MLIEPFNMSEIMFLAKRVKKEEAISTSLTSVPVLIFLYHLKAHREIYLLTQNSLAWYGKDVYMLLKAKTSRHSEMSLVINLCFLIAAVLTLLVFACVLQVVATCSSVRYLRRC